MSVMPSACGQVEELLVEPVSRHGHVARRHRVPERQCRLVLDRLADRVFVEIALLVVGAEDLERAFALRGLGDRRAGEADDRGVRDRRHHVGAEALSDRAMRFVDEDVDVVPRVRVLIDPLEFVDHRNDQATLVGLQLILNLALGVRSPHRDVLLLHLAEQLLDPAL